MSDTAWDADRFAEELAIATVKIDQCSADVDRDAAIRAAIAHFPARLRTPAYNCFQSGYNATQIQMHSMNLKHEEAKMTISSDERRETRAFWTGLVLLVGSVALSLWAKTTDKSALLGLRLMAGVGTGLIIAYLPGFFSLNAAVNKPPYKLAIKATGALAAFVMVYLFDPGWFSSLLSR